MTPPPAARWSRVKDLFTIALGKEQPLRAAFLAQACGEDAALLEEVQALLDAHRAGGSFLEHAAAVRKRKSLLPAGTRIGPYAIVELIGEGGMAQVYRARDPESGREVAIKVLPSGMHRPELLHRFAVEAEAAGAIAHPNICAVYGTGTHSGGPYLVLELLRGKTLRELLARGPLPLRAALGLAAQFAEGLAAAHGHGVVHRDLKPENLFVTTQGCLKILDFGIARLTAGVAPGKQWTLTGAILGSVGYMSPEQVRGERADPRSDVFAFGLVLHEMLAGRPAFGRKSAVETGYAILNEPPGELPGSVPPALARLLRSCLEKEPRDRFQSAQVLAARIAALPDQSS